MESLGGLLGIGKGGGGAEEAVGDVEARREVKRGRSRKQAKSSGVGQKVRRYCFCWVICWRFCRGGGGGGREGVMSGV